MNLSNLVQRNAFWNPNATAVICTERDIKYTHSELDTLINRFGNALLDMGVKKGDRVALYLPNSPEFIIAHFAIARIGAISVPFNVMYKGSEIKYIVNNSRPKVLIAADKEATANVVDILPQLPSLEKTITVGGTTFPGAVSFSDIIARGKDELPIAECEPDDTVSILYTSGTTGQPKGAMLTHSNYLSNAELMDHHVLHINDQDIYYTHTPYCHIFYVFAVLGPISAGAAIVSSPRFIPENALANMAKYKVTHYSGVPTMYIYMLNAFTPEKYDVTAWRFAQAAGASMPAEHIQTIEDTFGVYYCECYGATETSTTCTYGRIGHGKVGSIGPVAQCGWQAKIIDENGKELGAEEVGELVVKGPGVFKAYWEMPEATSKALSADGWFKTGDLVRRDEDGYYYIVDRKNDMILCGGYNVYPREIEEVLYTNPKILEAAVIGLPDKEKGELPVAYITLKPDATADSAEIVDYCRERMAAYKSPRRVEIVKELPKNPTGKILKRVIRDEWNK